MKRQRGLEGAPGWRRPPPRCLRAGLATKGQAVAFSSPGPPRPHSRCPSGTGQPPGRSPARGRRTRCLPTRSRGAPGQVHATVGGPFRLLGERDRVCPEGEASAPTRSGLARPRTPELCTDGPTASVCLRTRAAAGTQGSELPGASACAQRPRGQRPPPTAWPVPTRG